MSHHIADSIKNIRRSPYQAMAAILILTQTFFLAYVFLFISLGSQVILQYFETQPQITAFFQTDTEPDKIMEIAQELEQESYIKEIVIISKEEALEIYQEQNKDDQLLLQLVTAEILPASIEVSTVSIDSLPQLESKLQEFSEIDEVVFQRDIVEKLTQWTSSIRIVGVGLLIIMALTSIILIMVITGMKISSKRYAIKTMQLLGASRWYIKAPFFYEGVIYGLLSALIGWIILYTVLLYITPWLLSFLGDIPLLPVSPVHMLIVLGAGITTGAIFGGLSTLFASQRFLK